MIDARFADISFPRCEQEMPYCHKLQEAIDERTGVEQWDLQLRRWFLDKPCKSYYLMQGWLHRTRTLEFEGCQCTAVPVFCLLVDSI